MVRDLAPIPDREAKRRVLTVLGRTSAVVASALVSDEADLYDNSVALVQSILRFLKHYSEIAE